MKKITILIFLVIILQNTCYANSQIEPTIDENVILALVWPKLTDAVNTYYSEYISGNVTIAPYENNTRIVSIEKNVSLSANEECYSRYIVIVEVMPFIGAHNAVGKDHVKIGVDAVYGTKVCHFQHIESYEIVHPYHKERIIKPLP